MAIKEIVKKGFSYIGGLNGILFILYTVLIFSSYAFISKNTIIEDFSLSVSGFHTAMFIRSVGIITFLSLFICPFILKKFNCISIPKTEETYHTIWFFYFFVAVFAVLFLHYIAYYPGGFSQDSFVQYKQAVSNQYGDWHPVFHTLFAIKLPLLITGGWIGSVVLFQIIVFPMVLAYAIYQLLRFTGIRFAIGSLIFILLNPTTSNVLMFPWKDTSFMIGAILLMTFAMQIFFTNGEWCSKKRNIVLLIITISFTTLFRHNAVLFTLPCLFAIAFSLKKKQVAIISLTVLLIVLGIKYPLYNAMNVKKPNARQVETLGLPMTVIGAIAKYDFDVLDEETKDFVLKVAPREIWDETYVYGSFNVVKFRRTETNCDVIEEYGTQKVLSMMMKCFKASPVHATLSLIRLTDGVYSLNDDYLYGVIPNVDANDVGIKEGGVSFLKTLNYYYTAITTTIFPHLFTFVGTVHFVFIAMILAKFKFNRWNDLKTIFYILPVFVYNFGSMLLLSHYGDVYRYFYYTFMLVPILLAILLINREERSSSSQALEK